VALEEYERALVAFHRSLSRSPPTGTRASATYRLDVLPWAPDGPMAAPAAAGTPAYEDWYLIEDFASLGVLNEAGAGRGHRTTHDDIASRSGAGAAGLYALLEGEPCAEALGAASLAVWITPPAATSRRAGAGEGALAEMLGDGMDGASASLWRRQLVLGPAPEFCILGREVPSGASPARLPQGWSTQALSREVLWSG
jgi:hypothetical protein